MSEQQSQAHVCSQCGQDMKGNWVCTHCGHVDIAYFVVGAAVALFCIAIAIVATIALLPAESGGQIAALTGVNLVCGGSGLIIFLVVLSEIKKGIQLLRQLGDRSSDNTMRKAVGWVIGLSVVGILVSAGVGLQVTGGVERFLPTPTIIVPPRPTSTPSPTLPAPRAPNIDTVSFIVMGVSELLGIVFAVVAFRKRHPGRGIAILVAMFSAAIAVAVFSTVPFNPDTVGRREDKPAKVGTSVSIEDLTLVVTRVWADRTISKTYWATNARRMYASVQVTCELAR